MTLDNEITSEREKPAHIAAKLEALRKTPRKRPDWASMMKEIEVGKQLRRVQTNDRSRPILPQSKAKGKVLPGKPFTPLADESADDTNTKEVVITRSPPLLVFIFLFKKAQNYDKTTL